MGFFSSSSPAEKKRKIREQYDAQIKSAQMTVDSYKKKIADAQWQKKMTKDKAWNLTIELARHSLKQAQEHLKNIKAAKAAALKNV